MGQRQDPADGVSGRSAPWQRKWLVDMAVCLFTRPGVMGQGTNSGVSVVQEAAETKAIISQGEEWE